MLISIYRWKLLHTFFDKYRIQLMKIGVLLWINTWIFLRTYYLEVETVASTIEFVVGYCTGPSEGNYDYQEFERDPSDNSIVTVREEVCIPFSEYDPENLNTYTIKYTTQYFKNA